MYMLDMQLVRPIYQSQQSLHGLSRRENTGQHLPIRSEITGEIYSNEIARD